MIVFDSNKKNRLVLMSNDFIHAEEIAQQLIAENVFGRVNPSLRYRRLGDLLSDISILVRDPSEWNDRQN